MAEAQNRPTRMDLLQRYAEELRDASEVMARTTCALKTLGLPIADDMARAAVSVEKAAQRADEAVIMEPT